MGRPGPRPGGKGRHDLSALAPVVALCTEAARLTRGWHQGSLSVGHIAIRAVSVMPLSIGPLDEHMNRYL
jgi:hypothetical protein